MSVRYVLINKISFVISLNAMDVFTVTLYVCVDITFFSKGGRGCSVKQMKMILGHRCFTYNCRPTGNTDKKEESM